MTLALLQIAGGLLRTYVIQVLWGWFITPQFGIPVPRFLMVYGLQVIVGLLITPVRIPARDKEFGDLGEAVMCLIYPLVALFFGWVAKSLL